MLPVNTLGLAKSVTEILRVFMGYIQKGTDMGQGLITRQSPPLALTRLSSCINTLIRLGSSSLKAVSQPVIRRDFCCDDLLCVDLLSVDTGGGGVNSIVAPAIRLHQRSLK